jgi:hypothetical protein
VTASPYQIALITQLHAIGLTSRQIARKVGLMRHEVMAILRQAHHVKPPTAMVAVIRSTPRVYVVPKPVKAPVVRGHVFTMFRG